MKKNFLLVVFALFMISISIDVEAATDRVCYYRDSTGKESLALKVNISSDGYPNVNLSAVNNSKFANYGLYLDTRVSYDYSNNCPSYLQYSLNGSKYIIGTNLSYYSNLGYSISSLSFSRVDAAYREDSTSKPNNKTPNYNLGLFGGVTGTNECPAIFGSASDEGTIFGFMSKYVFTPIRWLTPIVLIILTSLDFAKAVFADEKDGMKKAQSNFVKRAVAALIIFLAPTIVSILLTLIDGANVSNCLNSSDIGNL